MTSEPRTQTRRAWMDILRGLAIILVLVFHAIDIAAQNSGHQFTRLDQFIAVVGPLRMPLLFFLSGLLVPRSLLKGAKQYLRGKLRRILYPYVLWSLLMIVAFWIATFTIDWWWVPPAWKIVLDPFEHLWFLAYIFVYYLIALATRRVNPAYVVLGGLILYSIPMEGNWGRLWASAVPFFLGILIAKHPNVLEDATKRLSSGLLLLIIAFGVTIASVAGAIRLPPGPWAFPVYLAFFAGVIAVVRPIQSSRLLRPLVWVGQRTLPLYVMHWPFLIFTLRAAALDGWTDPYRLLLLGLFAAFVPPLIITVMADYSRSVAWLFEWRPRSRSRAHGPQVSKPLSISESQ